LSSSKFSRPPGGGDAAAGTCRYLCSCGCAGGRGAAALQLDSSLIGSCSCSVQSIPQPQQHQSAGQENLAGSAVVTKGGCGSSAQRLAGCTKENRWLPAHVHVAAAAATAAGGPCDGSGLPVVWGPALEAAAEMLSVQPSGSPTAAPLHRNSKGHEGLQHEELTARPARCTHEPLAGSMSHLLSPVS
jgi:hypothetical protein